MHPEIIKKKISAIISTILFREPTTRAKRRERDSKMPIKKVIHIFATIRTTLA
jgi:hypothetical protein